MASIPVIKQGSTLQWQGTITDSDGVAVDLTGYTFRGGIKKRTADTVIPFTFSLATQSGDTLGVFYAGMTATVTAAIVCDNFIAPAKPYTSYLCDMEIIYPTGEVYRIFESPVNVSSEVTN